MGLINAIRGMNDILPDDMVYWTYLERCCRTVVDQYGYREIRLPLMELTDLFKRTIGEVTDIVEKEMYTFLDRNGDSVTLRPEGTAGCVRAGIEHSLFYNQVQRLWYLGPMFRHERPQKGRYRQFYQLGVEAYGMATPDIDVELLLMGKRLWQSLALDSAITLQLNTLGTAEVRARYRQTLIAYFEKNRMHLDEDSVRRLGTNPLRILDSKNEAMQALIAAAPTLIDHLDAASRTYFDTVCHLLKQVGVAYTINPRLVRGLDYYGHTVFEWVTTALGAQGTVCAGGRYDALVAQLGGSATPAIGFAAGLERLVLLLQAKQKRQCVPDVYGICVGEGASAFGLAVAEALRTALPDLRIAMHLAGGSFKSQFKQADKSGAHFAIIVGEAEVAAQQVLLKYLRQDVAQQAFTIANVIAYLKETREKP